jgi:hypothetical protein
VALVALAVLLQSEDGRFDVDGDGDLDFADVAATIHQVGRRC